MPEYEIREFREGDRESLLETFNLVFGQRDPAFRPRTPAQWSWAFERNPAGRRVWLALCEGRVVAQYAALPVRVHVAGEERIFAQIVDSMAHPEHRAGLKRPGLFVQTALPFFEAYGGPDRDLVHYGWPIEEAWRIGKTYLDYEMVRVQYVLAREPGPGPAVAPQGVETIERFGPEVRALWERCAADWGASAIRDQAFLNWRFADNPYHEYALLAVRGGAGELRGAAVYRFGDWVLPRLGLLVDWLVPPGEAEAGELLLQAALARARADGALALTAIFPEWSPWFARFQERGFRVHPSDYFMVARNFAPRFDMLWLRDHWWYQLADTDLA